MLKRLTLKNLILIDSCEVEFQEGFTILSGETGAGKTALIEAIGLALGRRADSSCIRNGEEKALVEACFDIQDTSPIHHLLQEGGIDFDSEDFLIIRREIARNGKNRAFINSQMVPLPLIQSIGSYLIDLIGQHSHHYLRSGEEQRELLDLYGDCKEDLKQFKEAWNEEKAWAQKVEELSAKNAQKERNETTLKRELEELEQAALKENEETTLFEEYSRHANAQELTAKITQLLAQIGAASLSRCASSCHALLSLAPSLKEASELLQSASISVDEARHALNAYLGKLDPDPRRFAFLEERLSLIHRIQRKYGPSFEKISAYQKQLTEQLSHLSNLDAEIADAEEAWQKAQQATLQKASLLSQKRSLAAKTWSEALTASLQSLNMKGATLTIELSQQPLSSCGADGVQFWLRANVGESPSLVKESSSGGELSRIMFALKTSLAEKNQPTTMIFDEIDANVGGETAAIIGEKLKSLARYRQVLCVTHFPQVACQADHHLCIEKQEHAGRTLTHVTMLDLEKREQELVRMLGGSKAYKEISK